MSPKVRRRMLERIAERGSRGLGLSWITSDFGNYQGWRDVLDGLVEDGHVRLVELPRWGKFGRDTTKVYVAIGGSR